MARLPPTAEQRFGGSRQCRSAINRPPPPAASPPTIPIPTASASMTAARQSENGRCILELIAAELGECRHAVGYVCDRAADVVGRTRCVVDEHHLCGAPPREVTPASRRHQRTFRIHHGPA